MKKKIVIYLLISILILTSGVFIVFKMKNNYVVEIEMVDNKSPDRVLKVLKNDKEIEFDSIYYLDDIYICSSENPTVGKTAIKNIDKLKIKLKNGKTVVAVIKED